MGKLSLLAGFAAGYVLGAKAGTERYEQIKLLSNRVWQSDPVQKQVDGAKLVAKTKVAPAVADAFADAARGTAERMRTPAKTVPSEVIAPDVAPPGDREQTNEPYAP